MMPRRARPSIPDPILRFEQVGVAYHGVPAVRDVDLDVAARQITALIGPSGCGKSTLLRTVNRMNDLVAGVTLAGRVSLHGQDLYAPGVDPVEVRRRVGMVFQKPNPFSLSIADNVAFGPRLHGRRRGLDDVVEHALRAAALWDEVKDLLDRPALSLSGGQQQRLCIARALAIEPELLLMDEPCSALDPIATLKIEDLMRELRQQYTIVIVTHNLQQAGRVSDYTAFLSIDLDARDRPGGELVEYDRTETLFTAASDPRTEAYLTGRFG
jgi:phosphate transport system ATP-binding protein